MSVVPRSTSCVRLASAFRFVPSCRRPVHGAIVGVALACGAQLVVAQTAERPPLNVGDRWTFHQVAGLPPVESDWSREIDAKLVDGRFRVRAGNRTLIFDGEMNSLDKRGADYSWRRFAFPMAVGNRWSHEWKLGGEGWSGYAHSQWEVKAYEKITVPAGTFDCFRVEGTIWRNTLSARAQGGVPYQVATVPTTYWYCPDVKWIARYRSKEQAFLGAPYIQSESVLTKFSPGS
jgi:hypothetical protein